MKNHTKKTAAIAIAALLMTAGMTGIPQRECLKNSISISAAAEETASEYTVNIQLMQFHSEGLSMGNASMNPEAHIIVKPDGTAEIQIDMVSLTYLGKQGYLGWLKKVTKVLKENDFQYPTEIESVDANIIEEYVDVYDDFNKEKSKYADSNVVGKWYPKKLGIAINFEEKEDEILVQVYVPVMESIMPGGGTKFAVLDIDWDSLKQISGNEQTTTEPAQTTTETSQTTTTVSSTTATETTPTTTPATTEPAENQNNNLADGKYELQAEMIKADRSGYSMSNNGINHTVQLEVKNGEYFVTMQFMGLAMYNQFGYLKDLYYYNKGYTYNQYGKPEGDVTMAEVLSRYDAVDQYNNADNLYPQLVRFPLVDKASGEYVPLRVFVPIMEAIAAGTGTQSVLMKLDWSTLKQTSGDFQGEEQKEQSQAFDYKDYMTDVKLHADQGVLPNDVTATVKELTDGTDYTTAQAALSDFKLYSISVSSELNGKMKISLPIPSGVTEPAVYRFADGKKTKINGTVDDGYYTFSVKETGAFGIGTALAATAPSETGTTASGNGSQTNGSANQANGSGNQGGQTVTTTTAGAGGNTTSPTTGDAGVGAVAAGLSLAAAAAYLTRRKNK